MRFVLRSPLQGRVSKSVLLTTCAGRVRGKRFTTPVSPSLDGDRVTIFCRTGWGKNLTGSSKVTLRLRERSVEGTAGVVADDRRLVADGLAAHRSKVRSDARVCGATFDEQGNPKAGDAGAGCRHDPSPVARIPAPGRLRNGCGAEGSPCATVPAGARRCASTTRYTKSMPCSSV
jgi:hypothetical protein